jgi:hypothetical protein
LSKPRKKTKASNSVQLVPAYYRKLGEQLPTSPDELYGWDRDVLLMQYEAYTLKIEKEDKRDYKRGWK